MLLIQKSKYILGGDCTAYTMGFLGHTCWVFSLLIGTEDKRINFFFMGLCRGIITFIIAYLLLRFYGMRTDLPSSSDLRKLNTRNGIMTIQAFGMTICVLYLPLPIVYTISNAGPVIVYVIDYLINHTTITRKQLLGIMVSCIGIILAINSHMIYAWLNINEEDQSTFQYVETTTQTKLLAACLFLVTTIFWAYAVVLTKELKHTNALQANMHLGLILIMYNALGLFIVPNPTPLTITLNIEVILKVGLPMFVGTGLVVASMFASKKSGNVSAVSFSTVFTGYAISIIRYGEIPNILGVAGSICIGVGLFLVLFK